MELMHCDSLGRGRTGPTGSRMMTLKHVIEAIDLLDGPVTGHMVGEYLRERGLSVERVPIEGPAGRTTFITVSIPGVDGKSTGGNAPTLGIIGMLGGLGARPWRTGLVSDADGALVALAVCLKLQTMKARGDGLKGDILVTTHICPEAPVVPHSPVDFMGSPVSMDVMNRLQVDPRMDAILSVDATKGNRILNFRGIAITPTVKDGWVLPVSNDLIDILEIVTGDLPAVLPISALDITPYGNGLPHINSILQPSTATSAPVVGVAVTSRSAVPGCATGANQAGDLELAARFCIEVAKAIGDNRCQFYDQDVLNRAIELYGPMTSLQGRSRDVCV
jgi:hypothetical protein